MSDQSKQPGTSNSDNLHSEFIVATSAREAVSKVEKLLAQLRVEAADEERQAEVRATKQARKDHQFGGDGDSNVDPQPEQAQASVPVPAHEPIQLPAESKPLVIEEAGPDFNPEGVIAQLMRDTQKLRDGSSGQGSDGQASTSAAQSAAGLATDSDKVPAAVRPILRRYHQYFEMEMNGAREALERGDDNAVAQHVFGAEVMQQSAAFIAHEGEEQLAERKQQLKHVGPVLKRLKALFENAGSIDELKAQLKGVEVNLDSVQDIEGLSKLIEKLSRNRDTSNEN